MSGPSAGKIMNPPLPPVEETMDCVICYTAVPASKRLVCGHMVCASDLDELRKNACPVCKKPLQGPLVTPATVSDAEARHASDEAEKLTEQLLLAERAAIEPTFDPNSAY